MQTLPIVYRSIGVVHSPYLHIEDVPRKSHLLSKASGTIELFPEYVEGLSDLQGFSHIILLVHHHQSLSYHLKTIPSIDEKPRGVFATRAPDRPNPIGLSIVNLDFIKEATLHVQGIDMIDGTPLLDITPYIPELSRRRSVRLGWLGDVYKRAMNDESQNY